MTIGLVTPCVMPPRPEPTTRATSGLRPANFASRKSLVSFTFAIIWELSSTDFLYNQWQQRGHAFVLDLVGVLHHPLGLGGACVIIVMHDHQRLAGFYRVAGLLGLLESNPEINFVRCNFAAPAERDHGVPDLVALDRLDETGFRCGDRSGLPGDGQTFHILAHSGVTTLGGDHFGEFLQRLA